MTCFIATLSLLSERIIHGHETNNTYIYSNKEKKIFCAMFTNCSNIILPLQNGTPFYTLTKQTHRYYREKITHCSITPNYSELRKDFTTSLL